MIQNIQVSVIVVTFNRINYFKVFIEFLYRSTKIPFNLIVVDNGSKDGTREYIEQEQRIWKYIFNNQNMLLARAFSEGLKFVETEFVVTVADDMFVYPELKHDWLEIFIKKMEMDKNIGCINFVSSRCCYESFLRRYNKK